MPSVNSRLFINYYIREKYIFPTIISVKYISCYWLEMRFVSLVLEYKTKFISINIDYRKWAFVNIDPTLFASEEDYHSLYL